jgi:hypothetical protein
VRAGLYANETEVVDDALDRLKQTLPRKIKPPAKKANSTKTLSQKVKKLTRAEFDQHLLAIGLLSRLPDTDADFDDPADVPITIKGEPLSETIIRERR